MKYLLIFAVIVVANGQLSDKAKCVNDAMEAVREFLPATYIEQLNRIIECKNPNVTDVCFQKAYGEPEPNSIEEALVATCTTTTYERMMKQQAMFDCIQSSDELIYNVIVQSFSHWRCMLNALTSMERGSLCHVRAIRGAEESVAFMDPIMAELGLKAKINKIKRAIPESVAPCFNYHIIDLLCDPVSFESFGNCLKETVTMKSIQDMRKNIERMNQRRRQQLDPEVIAAWFGNGRRPFPPSNDPNDWTLILNNP